MRADLGVEQLVEERGGLIVFRLRAKATDVDRDSDGLQRVEPRPRVQPGRAGLVAARPLDIAHGLVHRQVDAQCVDLAMVEARPSRLDAQRSLQPCLRFNRRHAVLLAVVWDECGHLVQ
jgi:hypothetical protein